ncbi:MAG: hypothetical protein ACQEP8_04200 [Chlamydiota bacterium]
MLYPSTPYHQGSFSTFFYREVFINSWWAIIFVVACLLTYEKLNHDQNQEYYQLQQQLTLLEQQSRESQEEQENLSLQLNSYNDYTWVELTLKREVGLVPEGQTKVYFYEKSNDS